MTVRRRRSLPPVPRAARLARKPAGSAGRHRNVPRICCAENWPIPWNCFAGSAMTDGSSGQVRARPYARHRNRKRPVFRSGPLAGRTASYLCRTALPREAWLDRIAIAEAAGCHPELGPRASEIVRQGVGDVGDAWSGGRAVLVEITGPAGGRWVAGDGAPAAAVRADPAGFLRLVTNRPDGRSAGTGDADTVAAFVTTRI